MKIEYTYDDGGGRVLVCITDSEGDETYTSMSIEEAQKQLAECTRECNELRAALDYELSHAI